MERLEGDRICAAKQGHCRLDRRSPVRQSPGRGVMAATGFAPLYGGDVFLGSAVADGFVGDLVASVPKGYFAVYVGAEARRFVVPMSLLYQPAFRALMELAAEEFGFGQAGGLRIPCREEDFVATVAELLPAAESRQHRWSAAGGRRSASVNW
ncbi:hypothetical protein QYE76_020328 [Lolium multiflorum]|uniref:Uncharacterized protein n=1 Tax=Lolium multiflorum TaxID=4521 RepID=A0AAD8R4I2_LOLMU|nr:hypothetical protein QYE76_020277 [Lolium multiflorum]KAK1614811.1 hypothetical protein QYE76_020328 [Lolium multiflorum]